VPSSLGMLYAQPPAYDLDALEQGARTEHGQTEGLALDASHFPAALGPPNLLAGSSGAPRYAAAAGASRSTYCPEEFPALPGVSQRFLSIQAFSVLHHPT
jgi:hypothetical protein